LSWNGGAQLRWTADLPQDYETQREWRLWSPPHKRSLQVEMHGLTGSGETHATTEGQGWSNGLRFGSADVSLQRLVAHWVNLPDLGPARPVGPPVEDPGGFWRRATSWRARIRDWDVRIDSRADLDEVLRVCRRDRTFALTHVMEVHRGDGSTFTGDQAHQLLEVLQLAVSFALGRSCCPTAPVGYAPDGRAAWSEWGPSRCDHAGLGAGRWWYERRGQDLVEMLEGFLRHWDDDSGRQTLKFTATSAVVAGEQGFVEQRLVTAASALEHLCWVTDVREGGVSETSYRNVPAHDRLRSLLTALRVPVIIDVENLPTLAAHAAEQDGCDGPRAITQIRNELVHPKNTRSLYDRPGLLSEAARLAARYLDLAILWRIGFTGEVMNRTKVRGWVGETELVPWANETGQGRSSEAT